MCRFGASCQVPIEKSNFFRSWSGKRCSCTWNRNKMATILTRRRVKAYSYTFIGIYVIVIAVVLLFSNGVLDPTGKPIGTDFLAHYAGSQMALGGDATAAYDNARFLAVEAGIIGANPPPLYWLYPPTYFLFVLPLALFPYAVALASWMTLTGAGYIAVIRATFPDRLTLPVTLAFPGTLQNLLQGQNGFLSALLLGGGLLLITSRPIIAGLLLGLTSYKPHLTVLVPVALLVGRQWKVLAGYCAAALGIIAVSATIFGWEIWATYIEHMLFAGQLIEGGEAPLFKSPTTYAFATLLGAGPTLARTAQGLASLTALGAVIWVWWHHRQPLALKAAVLVTGCLLFTPYAYDYDLALLAIPIAWMARDIVSNNHDPRHEMIFVAAWTAPLALPIIAAVTNLQLGPLVLLAILWLIVQQRRKTDS